MVAVGGGVDVGADVGTSIVVDEMGDFSFFLSFAAAIVINTIPTIKKTNATTNTPNAMIRSFGYFLVKVVIGPSTMTISVLLEDSMIGSHSAGVPCLTRLVQGRSLRNLQQPIVRDKAVIGTIRKSDPTMTNRTCNAEKCVTTI